MTDRCHIAPAFNFSQIDWRLLNQGHFVSAIISERLDIEKISEAIERGEICFVRLAVVMNVSVIQASLSC